MDNPEEEKPSSPAPVQGKQSGCWYEWQGWTGESKTPIKRTSELDNIWSIQLIWTHSKYTEVNYKLIEVLLC